MHADLPKYAYYHLPIRTALACNSEFDINTCMIHATRTFQYKYIDNNIECRFTTSFSSVKDTLLVVLLHIAYEEIHGLAQVLQGNSNDYN